MVIYRPNTGKKNDLVTFMVNLVEALYCQFAETECIIAGHWMAENIIPLFSGRHFFHKVPPSGNNRCRGSVWYAPNTGCLWGDIRLCLEECFKACHTTLNF
jgi:hypothetical protein